MRLKPWHIVGIALVALAMGLATSGCTRAVIVPPQSYDIIEPMPGCMYELETADGRQFETSALERVDSTFIIHNLRGQPGAHSVRRIEPIEPVALPLDRVARLRRFESGVHYRRGRLAVGDRVRVEHSGGTLSIGRVRAFDDDAIRVETDWSQEVEVPVWMIHGIERYNPGGRNFGSKTAMGLMIGIGLGLLAERSDGSTGHFKGIAVVGGIGIGTLTGFLIACLDAPDNWNPVSLRDLGADDPPGRTVFGEI